MIISTAASVQEIIEQEERLERFRLANERRLAIRKIADQIYHASKLFAGASPSELERLKELANAIHNFEMLYNPD